MPLPHGRRIRVRDWYPSVRPVNRKERGHQKVHSPLTDRLSDALSLFFPAYDRAEGLPELVFHDFAQHLLDVQTCRTYLLGNEAGGGHARGGIDLKHIDHVVAVLVLRDDVVYADDAIGMQDVVDTAGLSGNTPGGFRRHTRRGDFLHLSVVLGVIVEELVL